MAIHKAVNNIDSCASESWQWQKKKLVSKHNHNHPPQVGDKAATSQFFVILLH